MIQAQVATDAQADAAINKGPFRGFFVAQKNCESYNSINNTGGNMKKGFTLIELLVVVAIIGILTTIVSMSFSTVSSKARDGKRKADINSITKALDLYYNDNAYYPGAANSYGSYSLTKTVASQGNGLNELVTASYFTSLPADPKNGTGTCPYYLYAGSDPTAGTRYTNYQIFAILEFATDPEATKQKTDLSSLSWTANAWKQVVAGQWDKAFTTIGDCSAATAGATNTYNYWVGRK